MNVVIVDDSKLIRDQLKELFGEYPEISVIADTDDIAEALMITSTMIVDFFIVDISISNRRGLSLLKCIKLINTSAKIIMLTNDSDDSYYSFAKKLGVDFFFDKANEFSKLPGTILSGDAPKENKSSQFIIRRTNSEDNFFGITRL